MQLSFVPCPAGSPAIGQDVPGLGLGDTSLTGSKYHGFESDSDFRGFYLAVYEATTSILMQVCCIGSRDLLCAAFRSTDEIHVGNKHGRVETVNLLTGKVGMCKFRHRV